MGFLDIFKRGNRVTIDINKLKKIRDSMTDEPDLSYLWENYNSSFFTPFFPQQESALYEVAAYSDVIRTIHLALRGEIFRRGFNKSRKDIKKEDSSEESIIDEWIEHANNMGQSLMDVLEQIEDDFNTIDRCYIILVKEYGFNASGDMINIEPKAILRGDPLLFEPLRDKKGNYGYDKSGKAIYVSISNRKKTYRQPGYDDDGLPLYKAHFVAHNKEGDTYYIEGEVIYRNKYKLDGIGFSPIYSVWQKVSTLIYQDKYLRDYFGKQRPPKGVLFVNTRDSSSLKKNWQWILDKLKLNPHGIYPLSVDSSSNRGQVAQFINLMSNLSELQYTDQREEYRSTIGSLYGVSPIFQGDISASGGLNNEGLQITVTNRAVERGQKPYNKYILPRIMDFLGIENYDLELNPSEERDETAELDREAKKISNARNMLQMGFTVKLIEETEELDFEFSGEPREDLGQGENPFGNDESTNPFSNSQGNKNPDAVTGTPFTAKIKSNISSSKEFSDDFEKDIKNISNKIRKLKNYKGTERSDKINQLLKELEDKVYNSAKLNVKNIYLGAAASVEKELNMNIIFGDKSNEDISKILDSSELNTAIANTINKIKSDATEVISKTITENLDEKSVVNSIKIAVREADTNLSKIARTETAKIVNTARLTSYKLADPDDTFKYVWIGPDDQRTTDVCRNIKDKTKQGVKMGELIDIIEQEAKIGNPGFSVDRSKPVPHYQCRHVPIRVS